MADIATLEAVKLSMGITASAYDTEISDLIDAGVMDLELVCGTNLDVKDKLVLQAVKTYVRMSFRSPADFDRLLKSYESQKGQLMIASGYTDWGDSDGSS